MPRRNALLDHPQRARIEAAIRADTRPLKAVAVEFDAPYDSLKRYARRLLADPARLERGNGTARGPVQTFAAAFGLEPTEYQVALLTDPRHTIVLKSRQSGFSTAAAALAIHTARATAGSDTVIVSPSLTQSKEVLGRARNGLYELQEPLVQDSTGLLRLKNGSRIVSLPGNQRAVRGYAPALVIADEASWIADETYSAIRPLLAASGGRLVVQSTPGAEIGWFFEMWQSELGPEWLRLEVPAADVPFIDPAFLEREQRELRPAVFDAEYACKFGSAEAVVGVPLFWDGGDSMFTDEGDDHAHLHS